MFVTFFERCEQTWKNFWDWATFRMFRVQQDPQFCLSHLLLMVLDVTESDKCNHQSWPLRFGHARCGYFKDRKSSRTTASFYGLYWHKNSWHGIILSVLLNLTWLSSFHHCTVHQSVRDWLGSPRRVVQVPVKSVTQVAWWVSPGFVSNYQPLDGYQGLLLPCCPSRPEPGKNRHRNGVLARKRRLFFMASYLI